MILFVVFLIVILLSCIESNLGFLFPRTPTKMILTSKSFDFSSNIISYAMNMDNNAFQVINDEVNSIVGIINSDEEEGDGEDEEAKPATTEAPSTEGISLIKEGINFTSAINGSDVRVGIIATKWNADIISGLLKGVNESLTIAGVKPSNVFTTYVPGAFEIPLTAKFLTASKRFDVIICLGCLIKGETMHFEYIAQAASSGIMQVQLETMVPLIFGVLTVLNKEQAIVRSTGTKNEGLSWGKTAVEMGLARMSALGVGRTKEKGTESSAFVTFDSDKGNATASDTDKKPKSKPFGF